MTYRTACLRAALFAGAAMIAMPAVAQTGSQPATSQAQADDANFPITVAEGKLDEVVVIARRVVPATPRGLRFDLGGRQHRIADRPAAHFTLRACSFA